MVDMSTLGGLGGNEVWFRDHQPWLLSCGYQLRPRYQPNWVPSWVTSPPAYVCDLRKREDYTRYVAWPISDATRLLDGKIVMLKRIFSKERRIASELSIGEFVSSPEQMNDPDNHCIPILEVLKPPNDDKHVVIVMPLLRKIDDPRFDTVGEALDFIYQILRGLRYLHRNRIAHRDANYNNVMMDASELYPYGFHPAVHNWNREFTGSAVQTYTRTQRPPKYYWIDFGLSVRFDKSQKDTLAYPSLGGDKSVPEHQGINLAELTANKPLDPFPTDIYFAGNLIRRYFTEGDRNDVLSRRKLGFDFLSPLVREMTRDDPSQRPTIDQCIIMLEELIRSRSSYSLRSQVWHITDNAFGTIYRFFPHWFRQIMYMTFQVPPIPSWRG